MPRKRIAIGKDIFKVFITERKIQKRVKELARELNRDYRRKNPMMLCILNGAVFFYADLLRNLKIDCEMAFLSLSSYGDRKTSTGRVELRSPLPRILRGRDVIVVEDIVDSGITIDYLEKALKKLGVRSTRIVCLLYKFANTKPRKSLRYVGFRIPSDFVIGYGLDLAQKKRNLRDIYRMSGSK
jgi:hypoxanthine phosphoribosyltransferase